MITWFGLILMTSLAQLMELKPPCWRRTSAYVCSVASVVSDSCDSMDHSPSGSSVHGISQAGILEWVAMTPPGDRLYPGVQPAGDGLVVTSTPKSALDGTVDLTQKGLRMS